LAIAKLTFMGNPRIDQQTHGAIDRRVPNPRHLTLHSTEQIFNRDMRAATEENLKDFLALAGML
jgi:hypothetical protein